MAQQHLYRRFTLLVLVALLAGWMPAAPVIAVAPAATVVPQAADPALTPGRIGTIAAAVDPHLPSIVLQIGIAPDPIAVGDTAVLTVTVTNQDPDPANDLVITAPTPDGALALPGPNTVAPTRGWRWTQARLEGNNSSLVLTGTLRLVQNPPGDALILAAQATVRGIATPIQVSGGAVVVDRAHGPATAAFTPGTPAVLRSSDGAVTVRFPAHGFDRRLNLRHTPRVRLDNAPPVAGFKHGFETFTLEATDDQGADIHQFTQPLTLTVGYTPEQLQALGIAEDDLTLFWFDTQQRAWVPIGSSIDTTAHTVTAIVDHFSGYQMSDGSSPSEAYIPSLQGWQVSTFTGAASYSYPIDVPAGPGGLKPNLELSYSSAATDGASGQRKAQQSSWAGKGWSLDTGSIGLNKVTYTSYGSSYSYYTMILNGQSFDLTRAEELTGNTGPNDPDPSHWAWRPTNESFVRVRAVPNGASFDHGVGITSGTVADIASTATNYGRGGFTTNASGTTWQPRYTWQVWTKDGTMYEFREDLWWGWNACSNLEVHIEPYKWLLSKVADTHKNTITYNYDRQVYIGFLLDCGQSRTGRATIDRDAWPTSISWGANTTTGAQDRYKVVFNSSSRASDAQFDIGAASTQYAGTNGIQRETRQLNSIDVLSNPTGTWLPMRSYSLSIDAGLYSDLRLCPTATCTPDTSYPKLRLQSITRSGRDGGTLPLTSFTYSQQTVDDGAPTLDQINGGTGGFAYGGWNRLTQVTNGQGGQINFEYANIGTALGQIGLFKNNHRVIKKKVRDGRGNADTWQYDYGVPNYNTLGSTIGSQAPNWWHDGYYGPQTYPNSAALYYNAFIDPDHSNQSKLAHARLKEFRGHEWVIETDPNTAKTKHWFYQGESVDAAGLPTRCLPHSTRAGIISELCFQLLRNGEFLKGREYKTDSFEIGVTPDMYGVFAATPLRRTEHVFAVDFKGYGIDVSGLWRAFSYETQTNEKSYEISSTPVVKTTKSFYNTSCAATPTDTYGNLGCVLEYNNSPTTPTRTTLRWYSARNDSTDYIVDRMWQQSTYDGNSYLQAITNQFYDGNIAADAVPTIGDLRRVAHYYDIPHNIPNALGITVHGSDTTFMYDTYGNRTTETTYTAASTRSGNPTTWGAPSGTARTTTIAYDDSSTPTIDESYSGLPRQITNPLGQNESATYDYQLGTLTSVIDLNNQTTNAEYDQFGRMVKLIKVGDTSLSPTVQAIYDDSAQPFRYVVKQKDTSSDGIRTSAQFYDGIGRKIQTKAESADGVNPIASIVTDMRYDGLGHVVAQSQPFYRPEASTDFGYTAPGGTLNNQTTTTYDGLGRPLVITTPDGAKSEHHYRVADGMTQDDLIDPNRHRIQHRYDAFGRLVEVDEIAGNCGDYWPAYACDTTFAVPWTVYSVTGYTYSALDLLTNVTDAKGNITSMQYDSLGRKSNILDTAIPPAPAMRDPDMGDWNYTYDVNGNLISQVDAKNQQICFYYDALNRLTGKHYQLGGSCPGALASGDVFYTYDEVAAVNGKGQRTSMSNPNATTQWEYDVRGRKTKETYSNVAGLAAGPPRKFQWSYDSADRVTSITYPSNEQVTYTYDAGWRQTSACSTLGCYVGNAANTIPAIYTALDQPLKWQFDSGNGAIQQWTYNSPMQRLQRIQVGTAISPYILMHRSYTYDAGGNVKTVGDLGANQTELFDYDERDRLVHYQTAIGATFGAPLSDATTPDLAPALSRSSLRASSARPAQIAPDPAMLNPNLAAALDAPDAAAEPARSEQSVVPAPAAPVAQTNTTAATAPVAQARPDFSRLPLAFVPNRGQADARARFVVRGGGSTLFFTPDEVILALPDASPTISTTIVRLRYEAARPNPTLVARNQLPGVVNFLIGNNPAQWQTEVPTYGGLSYTALYDGIDLLYDGADGKLKSTYVVAPGADPGRIQWRYPGATDLQIDAASGDLVISMPSPGAGRSGRMLIEHAPLAWQEIAGQRVAVSARFAVDASGSVSFVLGSYDLSRPLLIDPILSYSSYLGGNGGDEGQGIAVDSAGNIFVAGSTRSNNFPLGPGPFQSSRSGDQDAYVTKLNPSGSTILYSTYLGGGNNDEAHALAIDSGGKLFLTGETRSSNFPMQGALDSSFGGGSCQGDPCNDVFVTKLDPALSGSAQLKYSTYIGGNGEDVGFGIAADSTADSNAYVTGEIAGSLPITTTYYDNSVGGAKDAFLIKLRTTSTGSSSNMYATYLGGSGADDGAAVAIDSSGNAYVTGKTDSSAFPTKNAYQPSKAGSPDAFVTKLNPSAALNPDTLVYSTYLGGSAEDDGNGIAVDGSGIAYVTGYADSSNFPTVSPWQSAKAGAKDAFLATVNTTLIGAPSLSYSTYLGGTNEERGLAIARDSSGVVYLTGLTRSSDYPLHNPVQASFGGGTCGTISCTDSFITAFNLAGNTPIYSTYLGGTNAEEGQAIAADSSGAAYLAGTTWSTNFPTASPRQGTFGGGTLDAFVAKLTLPTATLGAATANVNENAGTLNLTVTLSATPTYTTTVGYATSDGTASAGSDYNATSGTLTFAPGVSSQAISVPIIDDDSDEPNETFSVALNSPSNAVLGTPNSTTVTIIDDDSAPTLSWQASNFNVGEASGSGLVTVLLSAPSANTVTVQYGTSDGSATLTPPPPDYTAASGTLTFAPGVTSQSVGITILNDTPAVAESNETVNLTLSAPTNATLGTPNPATLTILDDDGPPPPAGEELYTYDKLGNMLSKTGVGAYGYSAAHPHAVTTAGPFGFGYDANGNMTSTGGMTTTWDAENRPTSINRVSGSETYTYDADGERINRTAGFTTTVFLGGMWQEDVAGGVVGVTRVLYGFNGASVAQRTHVTTPASDSVIYLHGDHLGSVSVVSGWNGTQATLLGSQRFDPWGKVLAGGNVTQTRTNYTGQELDTTGLLYYHARYYDPNLGRFVSADTIVPGSGALTVAPSDATAAAAWAAGGGGPLNPQELNRYSYVNNNPIRYTDPTGHMPPGWLTQLLVNALRGTRQAVNDQLWALAETIVQLRLPGFGDEEPDNRTAKEKGEQGESRVSDYYDGLAKNETSLTTTINGRTGEFIPDFLDLERGIVGESKNVGKITTVSWQIRAELQLAEQNKTQLDLFVRKDTIIKSKELLELIESGRINLVRIHPAGG